MCLKNPECSWCEGRCREYQPTNPVKLTVLKLKITVLVSFTNLLCCQRQLDLLKVYLDLIFFFLKSPVSQDKEINKILASCEL